MKKTLLFCLLSIVCNVVLAQEHIYRFNGDLNEVSGTGPALTKLISCSATEAGNITSQMITIRNGGTAGTDATCGSTPQSVFAFREGGGLAYANNSITGSYTIHLFFKFTRLQYSYQRVIDFKESTSDNGIYIRSNGCLNFYTTTGSSSVGLCPYFVPDKFYLITLVRNGSSKEMKVYVNGTSFVTSYIDNSDFYAPSTSNTPIIFFRDDNAYGCEDQEGSIKYLSVKPSTSTDAEVAATWAGICSIVLPVKLTSFSASKQDQSAILNWKTAEEVNTSHFEIERSADGKQFSTISKVPAANKPGEHTYKFIDKHPLPGSNQYRLKMVDIDGSFQYSTIARVITDVSKSFEVFPNPAKDKVMIRGVENGKEIKLLSTDGRILQAQKVVGQTITFDLSKYPGGFYLLQYFDGKQLQQQKISKQE